MILENNKIQYNLYQFYHFIRSTQKRIKIQEYDIIKCKDAISQAETLKRIYNEEHTT